MNRRFRNEKSTTDEGSGSRRVAIIENRGIDRLINERQSQSQSAAPTTAPRKPLRLPPYFTDATVPVHPTTDKTSFRRTLQTINSSFANDSFGPRKKQTKTTNRQFHVPLGALLPLVATFYEKNTTSCRPFSVKLRMDEEASLSQTINGAPIIEPPTGNFKNPNKMSDESDLCLLD
ncbi:hypothetical protein V9T40_009877 [Parthenolecanium corni]|uniref:Uncharacterized protein n=1 Tax=Parthenolecanium corni TaxID=536013 RepID=A0AAN9Y6U8_9HEMI